MKKQLIRKLAMIMTTALVLSAAGCGGSGKSADEPSIQGTSIQGTSEVQEHPAENEANTVGKAEDAEGAKPAEGKGSHKGGRETAKGLQDSHGRVYFGRTAGDHK